MAQGTQVTIASGQAVSTAARIPARDLLSAVTRDGAWDTANLTFLLSVDGGATFQDLYDASGLVTYVVGTPVNGFSVEIDQPVHALQGVVKVRSGTPAAPVNQTADRVLTLYFEPA